jgi:hypothetical protein
VEVDRLASQKADQEKQMATTSFAETSEATPLLSWPKQNTLTETPALR